MFFLVLLANVLRKFMQVLNNVSIGAKHSGVETKETSVLERCLMGKESEYICIYFIPI